MKKISGRGLVFKDDRVLLIKRFYKDKHYYAIPGGKKEKNESVEETTVREILEETGILTSIVEFIGEGGGKRRTHKLFLCKYIKGNVKPENNSKATKNNTYEPAWVSFSDVLQSIVQPKFLRKYLIKYIQKKTPVLLAKSTGD